MKEAGPELQLCEKRCTTQQTRFQEDLCFLITQNEQTFPVFPSTFISSLLLKPSLRKASDADHHFHKQAGHLQGIHYAETKFQLLLLELLYL